MNKLQKLRALTVPLFLIIVCLFLSIFTLSGCQRQESSPYKVVDSEIWPSTSGSEKTFWLDNERVVFISNKELLPRPGQTFITIWNPDTGKIDFSHQSTGLICVQDGQVFFADKNTATGKSKHYRGPIDNPQEYPPPGPDMWDDIYFNCDWRPRIDRSNFPYRIQLKDDNYLEIIEEKIAGPIKSQGKTRYYERRDLAPVLLPVYTDLVSLGGSYEIRFNQLRNAYLISPGGYMPGDSYYNSMWWLSRDGHLTQVPFPEKNILPSQGLLNVFPLREGYLVEYQGGGTRSMRNTGARGLYAIKGENMEKVLLGAIHGVSISPDGCRAAFTYARHTEEYFSMKKPYRTVQTINFCEGRKEQ
jgi:hypothetical protein